MTLKGVITKFASRQYDGKTYWDLLIADSSNDVRHRFLSEVELSRFDADTLKKDGFAEGSEVVLRVRKIVTVRNGNPVVEGTLEKVAPAAGAK